VQRSLAGKSVCVPRGRHSWPLKERAQEAKDECGDGGGFQHIWKSDARTTYFQHKRIGKYAAQTLFCVFVGFKTQYANQAMPMEQEIMVKSFQNVKKSEHIHKIYMFIKVF
jgi:hypothetical protein